MHPISDLQIEYSLISRGIEDAILPAARELGIGITAYGVLSRGLISGHWQARRAAPATSAPHSPRFQGANVDANLALVEALRQVAEAQGLTVAQAAIAWVAAQGTTSCRWSARAAATGWRRRSAPHRRRSRRRRTSRPSKRRCPKDAAAGTRYPGGADGAPRQRTLSTLGLRLLTALGLIHIDLGPARNWGERSPKRASPFGRRRCRRARCSPRAAP